MHIASFDLSNDIIATYLDVPNNLITISSSGNASASGVWAIILNSTSAGNIPKPETRGSLSNISTSAAFKQIANYFYGTNTYIIDVNNGITQNTTVKVIQFSRPNLSEGLYKGSITAKLSASVGTVSSLTAIDVVDNNSVGSALGLTGKLVNIQNTNETWGSVFYDFGVMVFSVRSTVGSSTGAIFGANSTSGWEFGTAASDKIRINELSYKTRNILKRSIYFCRAFNKEFNYTFNPTARKSDGRILDSLSANPATFISTIGLYNNNDELLAVAKVSPVKKKNFYSEVLFKVQLDF